jgi:hypothetical protein
MSKEIHLMWKRIALLGVAVIVLIGGWYAFRPELLWIDAKVDERLPEVAAQGKEVVLAQGRFHSVAHDAAGTATIHQLADGQRVLRFTDFATSNGPALHVYLLAAEDAADSATVGRSDTVDLGQLKGNLGDQNYTVPSDVDLSKYRAVTIWCQRFQVNFATAPLMRPRAS